MKKDIFFKYSPSPWRTGPLSSMRSFRGETTKALELATSRVYSYPFNNNKRREETSQNYEIDFPWLCFIFNSLKLESITIICSLGSIILGVNAKRLILFQDLAPHLRFVFLFRLQSLWANIECCSFFNLEGPGIDKALRQVQSKSNSYCFPLSKSLI